MPHLASPTVNGEKKKRPEKEEKLAGARWRGIQELKSIAVLRKVYPLIRGTVLLLRALVLRHFVV